MEICLYSEGPRSELVIVSINYRLGFLGWFYHPAFAASSNNLEDKSGNFQEIFNGIVATIGSSVQASKLTTESAEALKDSAEGFEAQFSGVNLDEEAANLIEQQQAYQASARILSTARELFDTLLESV